MSLEHATLSGAQLHEPKGIETASVGEVYVANGSGSGSWEDPLASVYNQNIYFVDKRLNDIAAASSVFFNIPIKSQLTQLNVIPYGAVDADTDLSIYIDGVLFAQSLTVVAAGSGAGLKQSLSITVGNTVNAGDIVEIRSDGAATSSVIADVQLVAQAIA